jgi:hypothetical protein
MRAVIRGFAAAFFVLSFACRPEPGVQAAAVNPPIRGTFLQLLNQHLNWREEDWRTLFAAFRELRMQSLVVQWAVSGETAFFAPEAHSGGRRLPLETIMTLAAEQGMKVTVGLWHDPAYWKEIARTPRLVEAYLRRVRRESAAIAARLAPAMRRNAAFQGWYITEEIDDSSWAEPERRMIIRAHLAAQSRTLRNILPEARISLSCFSNANLDPGALEEFWKSMLEGSEIDTILFQDGIGAGKLDLESVPVFLNAVRRAAEAGRREFALIVELFEQARVSGPDGDSFQAVPASFARVERQLALAAGHGVPDVLAFSVPDYMTPGAGTQARQLFDSYRKRFLPKEPVEEKKP